MNCPLCGKLLVKWEDSFGAFGDVAGIYCTENVKIKGDSRKIPHYSEDNELDTVTMYVPPFRIINQNGLSKIGFHSRYKSSRKKRRGACYYKTILTCPALHPDSQDKLLSRIKLLLLMQ